MVGIKLAGAYLPLLRLQRNVIAAANQWFDPGLKGLAKGERSMCNWDEDVVTMATESVRDALQGHPENIGALLLASTSHPFLQRQNAGIVAAALNLGPLIRTMDFSGSLRAGSSALMTALDIATAGNSGDILVVGSEHRKTPVGSPQEMLYGDSSAALLVGNDDVALELLGSQTYSVDFIDQYRGEIEAFDYSWEERWVRDEGYLKIVQDAATPLLAECGVSPSAINHFILPANSQKIATAVAKQLGINDDAVADSLLNAVGNSGAAHALLMLLGTMEQAKPGDLILMTTFGQGCDALLFRATEKLSSAIPGNGISGHLKRGIAETNYHKFQSFNGLVKRDLGKRGESDKQTYLSALYRNRDFLTSFMAGKCTVCGTTQMPKGPYCINPECNAADALENVSMVYSKGAIKTWTADNLTFDLNPPAYFGMIEFDGGARLMMDFTDIADSPPKTGQAVSAHFRIKQIDERRGFRKYFWKAIPDKSNEASP